MATSLNSFNFPYLVPPPPPPYLSPTPPAHPISPPPPNVIPPPQPHPISPPPPAVIPPPHPHPITPPPPHVLPPTPPLPPPHHHHNHPSIITIVIIAVGCPLFLSCALFALCCFLKKKKKKKATIEETEIVKIDEHLKIAETIQQGPHGRKTVALSVEDDIHVHQMKDETTKKESLGDDNMHAKSAEITPSDLEEGRSSSSPGQNVKQSS